MIEILLNDRLGKKIRVKCNEDDSIGDLKKLVAAQIGTRPEKIRLQKWHTVFKDHITLEDYEIHDGAALILFDVYGLAPDSELDFSGDSHDDIKKDEDNYSIARPRKAGKRLSFSGTVVDPDLSEASNVSRRGSAESPKSQRVRRGSMAHPLAALKEIKRVGVKNAEETTVLAPVVRTARRISILAASPFLATPADDTDSKTDSQGNRYRTRTESYSLSDNKSEKIVEEDENEEET